MSAYKKLYLAKGVLKVKARGHWYTSGGEKGSFGYYPHLKDSEGYPVYPDTQIHGDLRMSAEWLKDLNSGINDALIKKAFGDSPNKKYIREAASYLYLTDLELSNESREKWKKDKEKRFDVKPRIEIDDNKRTVEKHMLVKIEMAYLEGLELESNVYIGYFDNEQDLNDAKNLLTKSARFLSGFGAFRSRGYGRGDIAVEWRDNEIIEFKETEYAQQTHPYFIKSLVNMRSRPIEPGRPQLVESTNYITQKQLRAWFVKTYFSIFNEYPSTEQIQTISFPYCYPSVCENNRTAFGYPPPTSTLKNEKGDIEDVTGKQGDNKKDGAQENFFNTKTKPLPQNMFVTNEDAPSIKEIKSDKRIRNSIEDNFKTKDEGGLFVQECIRNGAIFGGLLSFNKQDADFSKKAVFILDNIKPIINGAVFERIAVKSHDEDSSDNNTYLLTGPIPFSKGLLNPSNQIILGTERRYNTTLFRPRRNRIVILQGSVIKDRIEGAVIGWKWFGKKIRYEPKK